jgi:glycosyltransferase involved in cell wall biosynthesis
MNRLEKEIAVKPEWSAYRKVIQWLRVDKGGVGRFSLLMNKSQFHYKQMLKERDKGIARDFSNLRSGGIQNLVSIILPVFNGEKYIAEAITSIIDQSYTQWELIVVDDGSTDATRGIAEGFAGQDNRIHYHYQENAKLPAALNKGHELSKGEFITWTSDDNVLMPDCLEVLVRELSDRPDVTMLYANFQIIGDDGDVLKNHPYCARDQYPPKSGNVYSTPDASALQTYTFIGGAFLYRRHAYTLLGGYSENRFTCEDYDFFLRMNCQFKVRHTTHLLPIYGYRLHEDSLSAKSDTFDIPQRTIELQVFDDGRWDLLTGPTGWHLEGDGSEKANQCISQWENCIGRSGDHLTKKESDYSEWQIPIACVHFVTSVEALDNVPTEPSGAEARLLIYLGDEDLGSYPVDSWDGCIQVGSPNRIDRHWVAADNFECAWHAGRIVAWTKLCQEKETQLHMPHATTHDVSVVVCTNRNPDLLETVVDSFPVKTSLKTEIILVNNDPGRFDYTSTKSLLLEKGYPDSDVRLVNCYPMGLSFARNAGLRIASGETVMYLDDDVAVDPNLFQSISDTFERNSDVGVVGGTIDLRHPDPAPWWYDESMAAYWSAFKPKQTEFYLCDYWGDFPYGANWSGRKEALTRVGGFRNRYGRGSGFADSGEEIVAALAVQKIGYKIAVEPKAIVLHLVEPDRFQLNQLRRIIVMGYNSALCMSTEQRIQPLLGLKGSAIRVVYRLLLAISPKPIRAGRRIENCFMALSYFRYFCKLLLQSFRRLGKHPVLFD